MGVNVPLQKQKFVEICPRGDDVFKVDEHSRGFLVMTLTSILKGATLRLVPMTKTRSAWLIRGILAIMLVLSFSPNRTTSGLIGVSHSVQIKGSTGSLVTPALSSSIG